MAGLSGLAGGLGALGEGFVRGVKVSSDLADAEKRRGLQDLQAKQAQINLDRDTKMNELSGQLAQEFLDYRDGKGAYAPVEGQAYDRTSLQAEDLHYGRIQPLLQQQAILSGKNPALVDKELRELRREGYSSKVFQASQLLAAGDVEGGTALLGPLYNRAFPDGTTVTGTAYDRSADTLTMNTVRDGKESTIVLPRSKVVEMLEYGALNAQDAVKLRMRDREKAADREFEGTQRDKDRGLKVDLNTADNKAAMDRARLSAGATVRAAELGLEGRRNAGLNARDDKDYDDFQTQINDALGWNKSNPLTTPEQLQARNRDASLMTGIFNTTRDVAGKKLSAYEAAQIVRGIESGKAKMVEKDGFTIVDVGGLRAVMPKK